LLTNQIVTKMPKTPRFKTLLGRSRDSYVWRPFRTPYISKPSRLLSSKPPKFPTCLEVLLGLHQHCNILCHNFPFQIKNAAQQYSYHDSFLVHCGKFPNYSAIMLPHHLLSVNRRSRAPKAGNRLLHLSHKEDGRACAPALIQQVERKWSSTPALA